MSNLDQERAKKTEIVTLSADQECVGQRLDLFLAAQMTNYSRSYFKNLIDSGCVLVNSQIITKSGYLIKLIDLIVVKFPVFNALDGLKDVSSVQVQVIYEHSDFLIILKPAGLVVHAPQHAYNGITLVDWLLYYFNEISIVGSQDRPGIVHRLDMHTSGLMIIPRNNQSHAIFTQMFKERQINKTYWAVVCGHPAQTGTIDYPIVRHPSVRNKMTHVEHSELTQNWAKMARNAQSNYEVIKFYDHYSLVAVKPITGRTHQIRVHMASIGHILVGDVVYGYKNSNKPLLINRQALHAYQLNFTYKGQDYTFTSEPPSDIKSLI